MDREPIIDQGARVTSISGKGSKFSIMQCLEEIDAKILGPNGKKDEGEYLDDNDLLCGFMDGYNKMEKTERYNDIYRRFYQFILISLIFVSSYLVIVLLFTGNYSIPHILFNFIL